MTALPKAKLPTVLVVDDEVRSQEALRRTLEDDFEVFTASSAEQAQRIMETEWVQIIVCDQRMPQMTGVEFLKSVRSQWPDTLRIILSGYTDAEDIIAGVNEAGIYQYLMKPWQPEQLLLTLQTRPTSIACSRKPAPVGRTAHRRAGARAACRGENERVKREFGLDGLIRTPGQPAQCRLRSDRKIAPFDLSVLISGESGTGKEMLARAIHYCSRRADKAFVIENCGALPDQLLEAELFGYKRGAFTGAYEDRSGRFQQADGGTTLSRRNRRHQPGVPGQAAARAAGRRVPAAGRRRPHSVDVRVVAATHHDLEADVRAGSFREDLYYRLATVPLHVPALRERAMDIPLLAGRLLEASQKMLGKTVEGFSTETLACLAAYPWPGNVRELQNEILRMLALCESPRLGAELLAPRILRTPAVDQQETICSI
jgi:two-component system response regulator HupR/HoxA